MCIFNLVLNWLSVWEFCISVGSLLHSFRTALWKLQSSAVVTSLVLGSLCPFHIGWRIPSDRPRQRKIAFIASNCPITTFCHYSPVHTLLAPWQWKNIFHCHCQMNCRPVVENIWGTVEKQSFTSRTTNMQTKIMAA